MLKNFVRGIAVLMLAITFAAGPMGTGKANAQVAGGTVFSCKFYNITLRYGSGFNKPNGDPCTKVAQTFLNEAKYIHAIHGRNVSAWPTLTVDGKYGNATKWATGVYQTQSGLHADGIIGPDTWRFMADECRVWQAAGYDTLSCD